MKTHLIALVSFFGVRFFEGGAGIGLEVVVKRMVSGAGFVVIYRLCTKTR